MKTTSESFRPDWEGWEEIILERGFTLDRPKGSVHPVHPEIVYPIDYGYVNETQGGDGEELDIFVGSADNGLVAVILTTDRRKKDRECKLILNCSPEEIYLINGFINFDPDLMTGKIVMRTLMRELWAADSAGTSIIDL